MKYAIINDSIVTNVVVSGGALQPNWVSIQGIVPEPGIGWSYDGANFTSPTPIVTTYYQLTRKAFLKRFTAAEREALQNILATGTQTQKNKLNAFLQYLETGMMVELIDDYIITSVNLMETAGVIGAGRANVILTTPITQSETL